MYHKDTISFLVLQQFGVIPFEIRTLRKGHTEQRRTQRFYITAIVRHRGTVGAWRNRGYLQVLLMLLSTSLQSSALQDFLRYLYQGNQQHVDYASVALCAFGTSVILFAFTSVFSPSLCAFYMVLPEFGVISLISDSQYFFWISILLHPFIYRIVKNVKC